MSGVTDFIVEYDGVQHYTDVFVEVYNKAEVLIKAAAVTGDETSRHTVLTTILDLYQQPKNYLTEAKRPALKLLLDFVATNCVWYDERYCSRSEIKVYSEFATWMSAHTNTSSPLSFFMGAYGSLWGKHLTE